MTDTSSGILFTIGLQHSYYANQQCNDFRILPTELTQSLLGGHKILIKQFANTLYAGIRITTGNQPFIPLTPDTQLTFFLQLQNPLFFNYTNMPSSLGANKIYYFTNRNRNAANSANFLTRPIAYNSGQTYHPGDLATDGAGTVYQSILSGTGNAPAAGTYWAAIDKNQYCTEADALTWMPSVSTWTFSSPQASLTVNVLGYNTATGDYTAPVITTTTPFPTPLPACTLDLSALTPGKYILSVNGGPQTPIYINDECYHNRPFAVLDLFNDSSIPAPFALLTGAGALASPAYTAWFLNRYSIWKYILPGTETGTITDSSHVYQFTAAPATLMYSLQPIPLTEQILPLSLKIGTTTPYTPIPCPSPERLVTYQPNPPSGDIYNCSEIYLNY